MSASGGEVPKKVKSDTESSQDETTESSNSEESADSSSSSEESLDEETNDRVITTPPCPADDSAKPNKASQKSKGNVSLKEAVCPKADAPVTPPLNEEQNSEQKANDGSSSSNGHSSDDAEPSDTDSESEESDSSDGEEDAPTELTMEAKEAPKAVLPQSAAEKEGDLPKTSPKPSGVERVDKGRASVRPRQGKAGARALKTATTMLAGYKTKSEAATSAAAIPARKVSLRQKRPLPKAAALHNASRLAAGLRKEAMRSSQLAQQDAAKSQGEENEAQKSTAKREGSQRVAVVAKRPSKASQRERETQERKSMKTKESPGSGQTCDGVDAGPKRGLVPRPSPRTKAKIRHTTMMVARVKKDAPLPAQGAKAADRSSDGNKRGGGDKRDARMKNAYRIGSGTLRNATMLMAGLKKENTVQGTALKPQGKDEQSKGAVGSDAREGGGGKSASTPTAAPAGNTTLLRKTSRVMLGVRGGAAVQTATSSPAEVPTVPEKRQDEAQVEGHVVTKVALNSRNCKALHKTTKVLLGMNKQNESTRKQPQAGASGAEPSDGSTAKDLKNKGESKNEGELKEGDLKKENDSKDEVVNTQQPDSRPAPAANPKLSVMKASNLMLGLKNTPRAPEVGKSPDRPATKDTDGDGDSRGATAAENNEVMVREGKKCVGRFGAMARKARMEVLVGKLRSAPGQSPGKPAGGDTKKPGMIGQLQGWIQKKMTKEASRKEGVARITRAVGTSSWLLKTLRKKQLSRQLSKRSLAQNDNFLSLSKGTNGRFTKLEESSSSSSSQEFLMGGFRLGSKSKEYRKVRAADTQAHEFANDTRSSKKSGKRAEGKAAAVKVLLPGGGEGSNKEEEDGSSQSSGSASEEDTKPAGSCRDGKFAIVFPRVQQVFHEDHTWDSQSVRSLHWAFTPAVQEMGTARPGRPREAALSAQTAAQMAQWSLFGETDKGLGAAASDQSGDLWDMDDEGPPMQKQEQLQWWSRDWVELGEDGVPDMTVLRELHEDVVLMNLQKRYERGHIYTYIGSILLSLNPYSATDIYGPDTIAMYRGSEISENPPHIFAIANTALSALSNEQQQQCVIISGESGSGKTEAAKLILGFLSATPSNSSCPQDHVGPSKQILEAIPVLEAFGNAKTLRNNNSSRFGKYLQVFVERGVISGSITSEYLLERSRVVYQAANERNYHVFYELLVGLPPQQKQRLGLQDAEMYYYLNQGGVCELPGKSDGRDFQRLRGALERLGLSLEERGALFRILAAILHLGNVYFARAEMDRQEVACVASGPEMRITADLLQVSFQQLQMTITYKLTETMREKIFSPLSVEASVEARDTLAKVLYTQLFAWIIARLNAKGASTQQGVTLAILDIYGFEDLGVNSFEQLCINYANECLQSFINKIIFKQEQEEYVRDRLSWKEVPFCDNQPCLALIAQKPHGILRILDDQTAFPQASDHSFLQKCHYHHGGNELYSKPKIPLPEFTIKHYAGRVTYQVSHFVEKNREHVRQDVADLFLGSSCTLLAEIFQTRRHPAAAAVPGPRGGPTGHTVSSAFQHSLQELLSRMEQCNTCLIRCLKPNSRKEAGSFEPELVRNQLRYLGILETIRIRKAGFPVRMPFDTFIRRYAVLTETTGEGTNGCLSILNTLKPEPEGLFRIGLSQVFMKEALYVRLDRERERRVKVAAITIQRHLRGYILRKQYRVFREKAVVLQAHIRGFRARRRFQRYRQGGVQLRAAVRIIVLTRRYLKYKEEEKLRQEAHLGPFGTGAMANAWAPRNTAVSQLEVPPDLAMLLRVYEGKYHMHSDKVRLMSPPPMRDTRIYDLPRDINSHPFSKFSKGAFKNGCFGYLGPPVESTLTKVITEEEQMEAISIFKLVMRFMADSTMSPMQEFLLGSYVVQRAINIPGLRQEVLCQLANQTWQNPDPASARRGWLLLANCLGCFAVPPILRPYLLKYVSDHAMNGFKSLCQRKLIQGASEAVRDPETSRQFPSTFLEWTANQRCARTTVSVHSFDGNVASVGLDSWTTGEKLGEQVLRQRGVSEGCHGWTIAMHDAGAGPCELAGHDYVLDLLGDVELPQTFRKPPSYFLHSASGSGLGSGSPTPHGGGGGGAFAGPGSSHVSPQPPPPPPPPPPLPHQLSSSSSSPMTTGGGSYVEFIPPPPGSFAPSLPPRSNYPPAMSGFDQRGYQPPAPFNGRGEGYSEHEINHYVDTLFDPLMSHGETPGHLSNRLKGGGGMWNGNQVNQNQMPNAMGMPMMPMMPNMVQGMQPMAPMGGMGGMAPMGMQVNAMPGVMDPMMAQQALINQQAMMLAQQMTAAALQQQQQQQQQQAAMRAAQVSSSHSFNRPLRSTGLRQQQVPLYTAPPPAPAPAPAPPPPAPPAAASDSDESPPSPRRHVPDDSQSGSMAIASKINRFSRGASTAKAPAPAFNKSPVQPQKKSPSPSRKSKKGSTAKPPPPPLDKSPVQYRKRSPSPSRKSKKGSTTKPPPPPLDNSPTQYRKRSPSPSRKSKKGSTTKPPPPPLDNSPTQYRKRSPSPSRKSKKGSTTKPPPPPLNKSPVQYRKRSPSPTRKSNKLSTAKPPPPPLNKSPVQYRKRSPSPTRKSNKVSTAKPPPPPLNKSPAKYRKRSSTSSEESDDKEEDNSDTDCEQEDVPDSKSWRRDKSRSPERPQVVVASSRSAPEPTKNIKHIIRMYNNKPPPKPEEIIPKMNVRSEPKFVKRSDPRSEALTILSEKTKQWSKQGTASGSTSPATSSGHDSPSPTTATAAKAAENVPPPPPMPPSPAATGITTASAPSNPPPPPPPPPPAPQANMNTLGRKHKVSATLTQAMVRVAAALGATASPGAASVEAPKPPAEPRFDAIDGVRPAEPRGGGPSLAEDERIHTELHPWYNEDFYSYTDVRWKLFLRKEIFYPQDSLNNPAVLNLLVQQIVHDTFSNSCMRITKEECHRMRILLDECKVTPNTPTKDDTVKKRIVMAARDQWDTYFSRLFPAAGPIGIDIQMLAVSHKGIKLVKIVKLAGANTMYIKVLAPYSYADILYVTIANKVTLEFAMRNEQITIYSPKASQIKELVDFYCSELMRNSAYVIAVKSYFTDNKIMLSFRKGDVIKLQTAAAPMQDGARYGCVLRKTLNYFEDVHGEAKCVGWKFGVVHGRSGMFPADYVQPIAPPDFANSQPEPRREESWTPPPMHVAQSGAVAVAVASAPAASALSHRADSSSSRSRSSAPDSEENPYMEDLVETNPHIMVDFAKRHFRKPLNKKSRKGHESLSPADMVVFSRNPIQDSLIDIKDSNLNKQAVESFQTIMRFMGDLPSKGSDTECVYSLLRYGHQDVLKDEIYCQVIKQVTNNQSNKPDSAQKGWRLLYIITPYFRCTDLLKPYVVSYLHGLASKPSPFQGMAKVCEEQLQQTLLCGGRRNVPSEVELVAMMSGRNSKRQLFNLPGGIDKFFKVKTCTVALDVLGELCKEMELSSPQAAHEYAIIALCNSGSFKKPLVKREYVMDVVGEVEKMDPAFTFWIKRVVWGRPLVLSNSLYITMHFNQVRRDFAMGHLLALPSGRPTEQHLSMVARMAALQHRAKEDRQPPSQKDVESYIPAIWFRMQSSSNWQSLISQQLNDVHGMSALQARTTFLEKMSTLPLFGSNFFNVKGSGIPPSLGAVNLKGLQFVKIENAEPFNIMHLRDMTSVKALPPTKSMSPQLEIISGNQSSRKTTVLDVQHAMEMCHNMSMHMETMMGPRS